LLKTPRRKTDPRRCFVVGLALMAGGVSGSSAAALQCTLEMASLAPPALRLVLNNRSASTLAVLNWGTPFEGWMQPFVRVTRDGVALDYQGPTVKRGDPERGEYLSVAAGRSRSVTLALAPAFNVSAPGRYRIEPQIVLHDVTTKAVPRPRSAHHAQALACAAVEFEVR
jgi:hypothetical protein